ncbi:MAG: mucoidy inhibitor MuiA family protein [Opitutaceae bacterium]|nr:mucoidy inhibitor MuiA family protein [Opitutaceae bacterium]
MKTLRALLPCSLLLFSSLPALRAAPADSHISAVTVYADRAVVTRIATVDLAAGEQAVAFERLPAALLDQSLQVSGRGTAAATILDVNTQTAYIDFVPNARVQELEDQIRGLQKQQRTLDDRAQILNEQREFVKRMLQSATGSVIYPLGADAAHGGGTAARPTLDEWQKLYVYSEDTLGKIATEQQSLDSQREDVKGKQAALEQQLNELRGAGGKSYKTVTVRLAATTPGRLEVALRYAVPGASWAPSYDARLRVAERAVELAYFGLVRNGTGEDWNDIALTLSTARPNLGGGAPELRPWIVDVMRPRPAVLSEAMDERRATMKAAKAEGQVQAFNLAAGAPAMGELEEKDAGMLVAMVETGATSATFKVPVTVTLAANNTVQKVPIATAKLAANLQYQATPKMMETAFLSAYAFNNSEYPLLAGLMNTFLDDTFIASSRLKTVMPGEKFELQLGADEGIAIKRKLVNRFGEDTGLVSKGRRVTYEYLVTLTNNKKTAERVVFKEPVPVSRHEKIVVTLLAPAESAVGTKENPKEVTREEDGKLVWRLDLKPGEKREIPLKFSVEYPADLNVAGLE